MNQKLRNDAEDIARSAIEAVKPDEAVKRALADFRPQGRVFLVAVGKAAWQMAQAAVRELPRPVDWGVVVTKHGHVLEDIPGVACYEAGHPVPDENSFRATAAVLERTKGLLPTDTVLFLLSGGGSALFEKPLIPAEELQDVTQQLLACGADIVEMNTVAALSAAGLNVHEVLADNDAYHALEAVGGLIKTGPTGTNVNDVSIALIGE